MLCAKPRDHIPCPGEGRIDVTSPLRTTSVRCPACKEPTPQHRIRRNTFVAQEKEPDQHVVTFRWLEPVEDPPHPPHYFVWYCPRCTYADIAEDYPKAFEKTFGVHVGKYFPRMDDEARKVRRSIALGIDTNAMDFETALRLHLLAIHTQMAPPSDVQDHYKIGRLALRAAWIYRENIVSSDRPMTPEPTPEVDDKEEQQAMRTAIRKLDLAIGDVGSAWSPVVQAMEALRNFPAPLDTKTESQFKSVEQTFPDALQEMQSSQKRLRASMQSITRQPGVVPPQIATAIQRSLEPIKRNWLPLPLDETQATDLALDSFQSALGADSRLAEQDAYHSLAMIMTYLYTKRNRLDAAMEMVRGMYQSGVAARQELQELVRSPALDPREKSITAGRLNRVNQAIESVTEIRADLVTRMFKQAQPKIKAVCTKYGGQPGRIESALTSEGIAPEVIALLKKPGGALAAS